MNNSEGYEKKCDNTQRVEDITIINKNVLDTFYNLTGQSIHDFITDYCFLINDFLLDDQYEDGTTIPIIEQIRNRLDLKNEYEDTLSKLENIDELKKRIDCLEKQLEAIKERATYYRDMTKGAGGQSMNIMDRHYGMHLAGKDILSLF